MGELKLKLTRFKQYSINTKIGIGIQMGYKLFLFLDRRGDNEVRGMFFNSNLMQLILQGPVSLGQTF